MSELIVAENFPASNLTEPSALSADALSAQAVANVENASGFTVGKYVLIGVKGSETAEIRKIQGIVGNAITFTANLSIDHLRSEPIVELRADQIKFYRAANVDGTEPAEVDFTLQATKTIQADEMNTEYLDAAGGSDYWYKYTFYDSVTPGETLLADALAMRGGNYGNYATVDDVRQEAGLSNNRYITNQFIQSKLLAAQSEVNASLSIGNYVLPLTAPYPDMVYNATVLLAAGYVLASDYGAGFEGTNKEGQLKIKMARDILAKIEGGDLTGVGVIVGEQTATIDGYPDDTAEDLEPSEARMFTVTDKF